MPPWHEICTKVCLKMVLKRKEATMRRLYSSGLIAALLLGSVAPTPAGYITDNLGSAGPSNYALLSIGSGNADVSVTGSETTTETGGVRSATRSLVSSTPSPLIGNVYLGTRASSTFSGSTQAQGSVFTSQSSGLNPGGTNALNASGTFAALNSGQSMSGGQSHGGSGGGGGGGGHALNITGLNLANSQASTLSDFGNLVLNAGKGKLSGGATTSDGLLNALSSGTNPLPPSSGLTNSGLTGILSSPGLGQGVLPAGGKTSPVASHTPAITPPPSVPAPPSVILMGLGGLVFAALVVRSRRLQGIAAGS